MKKTIIAISGFALLLSACKPDIKGELGEPSDKLAGMNGTWEISAFIQQDPNNPIKEERDLSSFYIVSGQTPYRLTFNKSDNTYLVETGPGKNFFGTGGTWSFDNPDYPTYLNLFNSADTLQLTLGSVVRETDNSLSLELEKYCDDAATGERNLISVYKFNFNRVN